MLKETRNYFIMFFLLALSGMPVVNHYDFSYVGFMLFISGVFLYEKDLKVSPSFWVMSFTFLILILFQSLIFKFFNLNPILGLFVKLWIAYLSVKILQEEFMDYFVKTMVGISLISFVFFIPIFIYPPLEEILMNLAPSFLSYSTFKIGLGVITKKSFIIFEFNTQQLSDFGKLVRNCGPFWEPGAFAGFLLLALMFNTIRQLSFFNRYNYIFLITILSTQSTTGYICTFGFILVVFLIYYQYFAALKMLVVATMVAGIFIAFNQLTFLGSKINNEISNIKVGLELGGDTRFASAVLDWMDISRFPITGRGIWDETRVDEKFERVLRNNGLTNLVARWGVFMFFIFFYLYYKSLYAFCKTYKSNLLMPIAILILIWVASFSENYYEAPLFLALLFVHEAYSNTVLLVRDQYNNLEFV